VHSVCARRGSAWRSPRIVNQQLSASPWVPQYILAPQLLCERELIRDAADEATRLTDNRAEAEVGRGVDAAKGRGLGRVADLGGASYAIAPDPGRGRRQFGRRVPLCLCGVLWFLLASPRSMGRLQPYFAAAIARSHGFSRGVEQVIEALISLCVRCV